MGKEDKRNQQPSSVIAQNVVVPEQSIIFAEDIGFDIPQAGRLRRDFGENVGLNVYPARTPAEAKKYREREEKRSNRLRSKNVLKSKRRKAKK